MDRNVIEGKIESLRRCIARVESRCPQTLSELEADVDLQDIVAVNLERAVQLCVDMAAHVISTLEVGAPGTMGESFERLSKLLLIPAPLAESLIKAVGFRNVAVHAYQSIDWSIVFDIAHNRLGIFAEFAGYMVTILDDGAESKPR